MLCLSIFKNGDDLKNSAVSGLTQQNIKNVVRQDVCRRKREIFALTAKI